MNDNDLISRAALSQNFADYCIGECGCCSQRIDRQDGSEGCTLIEYAPAVEVVEVIRCKDCENFGCSPFGYSPKMGWCKLEGEPRRPDYYCASGSKKKCG